MDYKLLKEELHEDIYIAMESLLEVIKNRNDEIKL